MNTGGGEVLPPPEARRERLKELETIIQKGWAAAVAVGRALREIRDDGLYLELGEDVTFESYCRERWALSADYAYKHIDAVAVDEAISTIVDPVPIMNEYVGRELGPILREGGPERVAEAWEKVSKRFRGKRPPTARLVHEVLVQEGYRPKPGKSTATSGGGRLNTRILLGQFGEKLIGTEKRLDWFLTQDIANRRSIGEDTRKLAGEYADRLDAMAKRLREFAEGS